MALALRHNQVHLTSVVALGMGLMFVYWLFFGVFRLLRPGRPLAGPMGGQLPHLVFGGLALARRCAGLPDEDPASPSRLPGHQAPALNPSVRIQGNQ